MIQVFSGQNSSSIIGVSDKSLCTFPAPGVEVGSSTNKAPYIVSGVDYVQAPNTAFEWTWIELNGGTATISANGDSPFPTLNPSASTSYLTRVKDLSTGCVARDTMDVEMLSILANAGNDITGICENSLVQLGIAGQSNFNYSWSPASGLNFPIGTPNSTVAQPYLIVPNAPAGITYTVVATETTTGCQATDNIIITTDTDPPTAMSNRSATVCEGVVSANFGNEAGTSYLWSVFSGGGNLAWFNDVTDSRPTVTIPSGTTAGTYVFQITKTKGDCGSTTALLTITVTAPPIVDLGSDITGSCATPYPAISTTQEAGVTYLWSPLTNLYRDNAGVNDIRSSYSSFSYIAYAGASGEDVTYTLLAKRNGCIVTDEITILAATSLIVDAGNDRNYCPDSAPLNLGAANTGVTHTWTVKSFSNSQLAGDNDLVVPTPAEEATILGYLSSTNISTPTFSQSTNTQGVYVYTLTSTDAGGCTFSDDIKVIVPEFTTGLAGASKQICEGESVDLGLSNPSTGLAYAWTAIDPVSENDHISNVNSFSPTVTPMGTTTYRLIVTNTATSCTNTEYVTVSVTPRPSIADVDMSAQCAPISAVDLTAQIPSYETSSNQVWYQSSIPGVVVASPTAVTPSQTTEYFLYAENANGCPDTTKVTVNVDNPQTPRIIQNTSASCPLFTINLVDYQGTPSDPSYTLEWHSDNTTSPGTLISNTEVGAGTYYLFETTPSGCASASDVLTVRLITIDLVADASQFIINGTGKNVKLEGMATGGSGGYNYYWEGLGYSSSYIVAPWKSTTFNLMVTDSNGCTDTDNVTIYLGSVKCFCD